MFNLRHTHDRSFWFDLLSGALAVIGALVMWLTFRMGGAWDVLGAFALLGECLLVYGTWIEPQRLHVTTIRRKLVADPTTWIRIVFLSDLHAGAFHPVSWYERIAQEASALCPDLVLLGGDYVIDRAEPIGDLKALSTIQARLGKYYVLGNHDLVDRPGEIRRALTSFGYADLTNRQVSVSSNGRTCELQGVDDIWFGKVKRFKRSSATLPHITLSHEPDLLMDLTEGDTDLVLIGHSHGGQVRLPGLGAVWPIPAKLGRAVDQGEKTIHGIACIISNGLGESDSRLRLFCPPEILVVEVGI